VCIETNIKTFLGGKNNDKYYPSLAKRVAHMRFNAKTRFQRLAIYC